MLWAPNSQASTDTSTDTLRGCPMLRISRSTYFEGPPQCTAPFASGSVEGPSIAGSLQYLRGCPLHLH